MRRPPGARASSLNTSFSRLLTLKITGGSTSKAAEMLGISTRMIQYRLHDYSEAPRSDVEVVAKVSHGRAKS